MEAPENKYIDVYLDSDCGMTTRSYDNEIEYVRTDAFIEKACEWLKEQDEMIGVSFGEDFIERFKNYMKGE